MSTGHFQPGKRVDVRGETVQGERECLGREALTWTRCPCRVQSGQTGKCSLCLGRLASKSVALQLNPAMPLAMRRMGVISGLPHAMGWLLKNLKDSETVHTSASRGAVANDGIVQATKNEEGRGNMVRGILQGHNIENSHNSQPPASLFLGLLASALVHRVTEGLRGSRQDEIRPGQ